MSVMIALLVLLQAPSKDEIEKLLAQAAKEKAAGRESNAAALYQQILAAPPPTDEKAPSNLVYLRSEAQWQLAASFEAQGKFKEALAAWQEAGKTPRGSFCGNANASYVVMTQKGQGRCLEHLNRHQDAVEQYFKATQDFLNGGDEASVWRIAELYAAAGRTDSLKKILDRRDKEFFARFKIENEEHRSRLEQMNPNLPIRKLLDVRDAAHLEQWSKLADLLGIHGMLYLAYPDRQPPYVVEAAHLLAGRPDKAVPLLWERLAAEPKIRPSWYYYALGLCGTPEALAILKDRAELLGRPPWEENKEWDLEDVCYSLDLSAPGRKLLRGFRESDSDSLKSAMEKIQGNSRSFRLGISGYPPIPKDLRLD